MWRKSGSVHLFIGHYFMPIYLGMLLLTIISQAVGWTAISWILVTPAILTAFTSVSHEWHLCLHCAKQVPFLDPEAAVKKHLRQLRFQHANVRTWYLLFFVASFILMLVLPHVRGLLVPAMLLSLYIVYTRRIHSRLYPWCPYCRHGRGRDDDDDPPPDLPDDPTGEEIHDDAEVVHRMKP